MNKNSYFGFLVIASAMLGAMALSSCSHDDFGYSEEKVEQAVNAKYAAAFEKAFGKVGSDVDWGFSNKIYDARAITRAGENRVDYASYRGNMQPILNPPFPSDCDASEFTPDLEEMDIPSYNDYCKTLPNATQYWAPDEFGYGVVYIDDEQYIHINGGTEDQRSKLYIEEGTYSFTSESFYLGKNVDLVLLEGATVTFDNNIALNAIFDIYIAPGAELIANGDDGLKANSGARVYNHGTITCSKFEANSTSFLYNVGTLTAGSVSAESNESRIVNDGIINCASVTVNAGAVQNNYQWNVEGTTRINSNNSGWVNNGHWTTNNYAYVGGSENVINNCFLEVTNNFEMNISSEQGAFKIDGGGGVLTKYFYGGRDSSTGAVSGPFVITMGPKAVFVVEEDAQLEAGRDDDEGFGIFGPTSGEYAVFQAKNIVRNPYLASINSHGAVAYGGNLYVSAETHFKQGYDSDGTGTYVPRSFIIDKYDNDGFTIENNIYGEGFKSGKPNINIPKTPCSPGFQGVPLYRVIAEDLSAAEAGDFDFNDVVFDVVKAEGGYTTLRLICAGGVLPLRVRGANEAEGREVHEVFGDETPMLENHPMYNTGRGPEAPATEFTVEGTYTDPASIKTIIIEVYKENQWMELTATRGKAACKILVDDTFVPVSERSNIADKYGLFTDYVQGAFPENEDFWWKKQ